MKHDNCFSTEVLRWDWLLPGSCPPDESRLVANRHKLQQLANNYRINTDSIGRLVRPHNTRS